MPADDEYTRLTDQFLRLGYHVERRVIGDADMIVVASQPKIVRLAAQRSADSRPRRSPS